jgi:hypothetical protein
VGTFVFLAILAIGLLALLLHRRRGGADSLRDDGARPHDGFPASSDGCSPVDSSGDGCDGGGGGGGE